MPQPRMVPLESRGQDRHRSVEAPFQRSETALEPGVSDAERVRGEAEERCGSDPSGNGPGRCGTWGLRAPARCTTALQGACTTRSVDAGLKLILVRRNWAGQSTEESSRLAARSLHNPGAESWFIPPG